MLINDPRNWKKTNGCIYPSKWYMYLLGVYLKILALNHDLSLSFPL